LSYAWKGFVRDRIIMGQPIEEGQDLDISVPQASDAAQLLRDHIAPFFMRRGVALATWSLNGRKILEAKFKLPRKDSAGRETLIELQLVKSAVFARRDPRIDLDVNGAKVVRMEERDYIQVSRRPPPGGLSQPPYGDLYFCTYQGLHSDPPTTLTCDIALMSKSPEQTGPIAGVVENALCWRATVLKPLYEPYVRSDVLRLKTVDRVHKMVCRGWRMVYPHLENELQDLDEASDDIEETIRVMESVSPGAQSPQPPLLIVDSAVASLLIYCRKAATADFPGWFHKMMVIVGQAEARENWQVLIPLLLFLEGRREADAYLCAEGNPLEGVPPAAQPPEGVTRLRQKWSDIGVQDPSLWKEVFSWTGDEVERGLKLKVLEDMRNEIRIVKERVEFHRARLEMVVSPQEFEG
jgi:hypothetical protein